MLPPFGLILSRSSPSSEAHQLAWDANASLISYTCTLSVLIPAKLRAEGIAYAGPTPINLGGTPHTAYDLQIYRIGAERCSALQRLMRRTAADLLVIWDEFTALVDPPFLNTGQSLANFSGVVSGSIPSSRVTRELLENVLIVLF